MDGWNTIVPFGMVFRCEYVRFRVHRKERIDCFLPRNALQVDCLWNRSFDEVEEVHLMHGVVPHRRRPAEGRIVVAGARGNLRECNQALTPPLKINGWVPCPSLEVWFRWSFSFLFMGDGALYVPFAVISLNINTNQIKHKWYEFMFMIYIPGTHMTLVLIVKDLVFEGPTPKTKDKWVLGTLCKL